MSSVQQGVWEAQALVKEGRPFKEGRLTGILLQLCRGGEWPRPGRGRGDLPAALEEWRELGRLAEAHSLLPWLWGRLGSLPGVVPEGFRREVETFFRRNLARNLLYARRLGLLAEALKQRGIPNLAYKGPVLALQAYGSLACRQFLDLDLLVAPGDWEAAHALLLEQGYRPLPDQRENRFTYARRYWGEGAVLVELHRNLLQYRHGPSLDWDTLWRRSVAVEVEGSRLRTPAFEDLLLLLCQHGAKHRWKRLGWVLDVARLLERKDLDWAGLREEASRFGLRRILALGVRLAGLTFQAPMGGVEGLLDDQVEPLLAEIREGWFLPSGSCHPWYREETDVFYLRLRERRRDRMRYCTLLALERLSPNREGPVGERPPALHLSRPYRLLKRYGWAQMRTYVGSFWRLFQQV